MSNYNYLIILIYHISISIITKSLLDLEELFMFLLFRPLIPVIIDDIIVAIVCGQIIRVPDR